MKIPKACDECHRRKKRCDKLYPICSNCRKWKTSCLIMRTAASKGPRKQSLTRHSDGLDTSQSVATPMNPFTSNAPLLGFSSAMASSSSGPLATAHVLLESPHLTLPPTSSILQQTPHTFPFQPMAPNQYTNQNQQQQQPSLQQSDQARRMSFISSPSNLSTSTSSLDNSHSQKPQGHSTSYFPPKNTMSTSHHLLSPFASVSWLPDTNGPAFMNYGFDLASLTPSSTSQSQPHPLVQQQTPLFPHESSFSSPRHDFLSMNTSSDPSPYISKQPPGIPQDTQPRFSMIQDTSRQETPTTPPPPKTAPLSTSSAMRKEQPIDQQHHHSLQKTLLDCFKQCACVSQLPLIPPEEILHLAERSDFLMNAVLVASAWYVDPEVVFKSGYASRLALAEAQYGLFSGWVQGEAANPSAVSVIGLLLVSRHCYESGRSLTAYSYLIMAVEIARSLQLHTETLSTKPTTTLPSTAKTVSQGNKNTDPEVNKNTTSRPFTTELCRRIWWSCYLLDRHIAFMVSMKPLIRDEECRIPLPGWDPRFDVMTESRNDSPANAMTECTIAEEWQQVNVFRSSDWYVPPMPSKEKVSFLGYMILLAKIMGNVTVHQFLLRDGSSETRDPESKKRAMDRLKALEASLRDWMASLPDVYRVLNAPLLESHGSGSASLLSTTTITTTSGPTRNLTLSAQRMASYLHFWYAGLMVSLHRPCLLERLARDCRHNHGKDHTRDNPNASRQPQQQQQQTLLQLDINDPSFIHCSAACAHFASHISILLQSPHLFSYVLPTIDIFIYLIGTVYVYMATFHPDGQERTKATLLLDLHQLLLEKGSGYSELCANKGALLSNLRDDISGSSSSSSSSTSSSSSSSTSLSAGSGSAAVGINLQAGRDFLRHGFRNPFKGFRNVNVGKFWTDLEVLQLTRGGSGGNQACPTSPTSSLSSSPTSSSSSPSSSSPDRLLVSSS